MILPTAIVSVILIFVLGWAWARKIQFYSLVDVVWAFGVGLTAVFWLASGQGDPWKRLIAAGLIGAWSLRLGSHLQRRLRRHFPDEDSRYVKLRNLWKGREATAFFWFFQSQALSVILLALPFYIISRDASDWGLWETGGLIVALAGISGEALADHQMSRFKKHSAGATAVCREGLWRYSRHPNYFFESLLWFGFYIFACGSSWGWMTFYAPAMILYLVLRVTGIPPTEASAVARKGEAYRDYQRTTSAFIPWPPRTPTPS